jgi:hypothetical protein
MAAVEACLAMGFLVYVGWAQTPESPLGISILAVTVVVACIAIMVDMVGLRRPALAVLAATAAGFLSFYFAALLGYIILVALF